jgi:transcriptional regulator with PAS, ATPase and Fis domain
VIRKVAPTEASVLLRGESGTGKELIARCLHEASPHSQGPFVPIDCASLPENLLESELFGYEKGAFTGAVTGRAGLLEAASGGTIFLDEIGNVPLNLQAKLLRVLEEHKYRRVGGRTLAEVNARFIAATNSGLEEMVRQGTFREDLFYRLNVVSICLPPLRERPADLAPLAQSFLNENPDAAAKGIRGLSTAALMMMQSYAWPGNVRELRNVVWRAVSLTESNQITPLDLPPEFLSHHNGASRPAGQFRRAKQEAVDRFEDSYLRELLAETEGNVAKAARQAGMRRPALHRLLHKHKLNASQFRPRH